MQDGGYPASRPPSIFTSFSSFDSSSIDRYLILRDNVRVSPWQDAHGRPQIGAWTTHKTRERARFSPRIEGKKARCS